MLSIISIIIAAATLHPGAKPVPDTFIQVPTQTKPVSVVQPLQATEQAELVPYTPPRPVVADTAGNDYPMFACTWYAKSKRPDLPNHLGNANLWASKLKALGWTVSYKPQAGAIGQAIRGVHVVYIERVNSDGTVYLSERNWDFQGSFRYRTAPASDFIYVY